MPRRRPLPDWKRVRLFAMDVDGVLTDGTVLILADGGEGKSFSILDGHGLRLLERAGVTTAWISGRASKATTRRARELGIPHLFQGRLDKRTVLADLAERLGLAAADCAYMGDDEIDVAALRWAGIGIAPATAMPAALAAAAFVPARPAGRGAVREVCDLILAARSTPAPRTR
jgi:3-deoxy-D-manno-octulosonate 8-phosphate phosphatase (KDO 8-P phosphatase)